MAQPVAETPPFSLRTPGQSSIVCSDSRASSRARRQGASFLAKRLVSLARGSKRASVAYRVGDRSIARRNTDQAA
jgi:hypothetical protein